MTKLCIKKFEQGNKKPLTTVSIPIAVIKMVTKETVTKWNAFVLNSGNKSYYLSVLYIISKLWKDIKNDYNDNKCTI